MTTPATATTHHLLIGGEWVPASETYDCWNPAQPSELVGRFAAGEPEHVTRAYAAAAAAAPDWASRSPLGRAAILERAAALVDERWEILARALTMEEGKAIRDARGEAKRAATILRYYAGECARPIGEQFASADPTMLIHTSREPVGVVCAITPWNFPIAIPIWKIAPALAFGNTVVWKPATQTPLCAVLLTELLTDAGLPSGVLNLVTGKASMIGDALLDDSRLDAVTFTGSTAVGERIRVRAAQHGVKSQLELGGNNPAIVLADADIDRAAQMIARAAMFSTGQRCTATSRAIVAQECLEVFTARVVKVASGMVVGDPLDDDTDVGPLASREQFDSVSAYLVRAREEGLEILLGGEPGDPAEGYFVAPTIYADPLGNSTLSCEEVFGPVLGIIPARDADHALSLANDTEYGLSASVFTTDLASAVRLSRGLEAGVVHVNDESAGAEPHVPFGGVKASSSGSREQGRAALEFFTETKTTYLRAT
jgi:acyl-CoA reductase-like NAD-dependent aldehyde dehydrogenase